MLKRHTVTSAICIAVLVLWTLPTFAQDVLWSRLYGGTGPGVYSVRGYSVQQTTDGGYIIAGEAAIPARGSIIWPDIYLLKTNSTGDTLWSRVYGSASDLYDIAHSVQQTTDGGYIVAGIIASGAGKGDVYLLKTDSLGDTLWSRTYGGSERDEGYSVQQTTDGGYIVSGYTESFGAGARDVYLIKTDSLGDPQWSRTYGGSERDEGYSVQQTADGGYVVAGPTYSFGADSGDVFVVKTHANGGTFWSRTYGGSNEDWGYSVQQTTDGGYVVAGHTKSHGSSNSDVYLIKTDSLGGTLWSRTYGGRSEGRSVQQTSDEGYIVVGYKEYWGASNKVYLKEVYLIKTDSTGDTLWTRTFRWSGQDQGYSVRQTTDGGYIVAAMTSSLTSSGVQLTKWDRLGNTCMGESVSPTIVSVSSTVTNPATVDSSCSTIVTSPSVEVVSPETEVTTICAVVRGDADGDGVIDLGDVLYLISYLYKGGPAPDPFAAGDVDCNGEIELGDVLYLISYLYKGGPPPDC